MSIHTYSRQSERCDECGDDVTVRTILDGETGRYYFFCPACGAGNVEAGRER